LICEIYFCIRTLNLTFNQIILVKMEPGPKDFYFPSIGQPRCTYPFFRLFWSMASKFSANFRAINSTGNIPFNITREFPCAQNVILLREGNLALGHKVNEVTEAVAVGEGEYVAGGRCARRDGR
jgi:hypothetical protein